MSEAFEETPAGEPDGFRVCFEAPPEVPPVRPKKPFLKGEPARTFKPRGPRMPKPPTNGPAMSRLEKLFEGMIHKQCLLIERKLNDQRRWFAHEGDRDRVPKKDMPACLELTGKEQEFLLKGYAAIQASKSEARRAEAAAKQEARAKSRLPLEPAGSGQPIDIEALREEFSAGMEEDVGEGPGKRGNPV